MHCSSLDIRADDPLNLYQVLTWDFDEGTLFFEITFKGTEPGLNKSDSYVKRSLVTLSLSEKGSKDRWKLSMGPILNDLLIIFDILRKALKITDQINDYFLPKKVIHFKPRSVLKCSFDIGQDNQCKMS